MPVRELTARHEARTTPTCPGRILDQTVEFTYFLTTSELMGSNASWLFLGFLSSQIYTYCHRSKRDSRYIRLLVIVTAVVQIVDTASVSYAAYGLDSHPWGIPGPDDTGEMPTLISNLGLLTLGFASITTQWFFTWRILTFARATMGEGKLRYLFSLVAVLVILLGLCATGCCLTIFIAPFFLTDSIPKWWGPLQMVLSASTLTADILITIAMTYLLLRAKAQTCFGGAHDKVVRLIRLTLQTGLLTTLLALGSLILVATNFSYFEILWEALIKSYAISLFANLNARSHQQSAYHGSMGSTHNKPADSIREEGGEGGDSPQLSNGAHASTLR